MIGGAYSVDKDFRLEYGFRWFPDEQPSDQIKDYVEKKLDLADWKVDIVLSHTVPIRYEPYNRLSAGIDQSKIDKSTELWLDQIEQKLTYKKWYAGHYHCSKKKNRLRIMYDDIRIFGQ